MKTSGESHHVKESHYKYNAFKYLTDGLKIQNLLPAASDNNRMLICSTIYCQFKKAWEVLCIYYIINIFERKNNKKFKFVNGSAFGYIKKMCDYTSKRLKLL